MNSVKCRTMSSSLAGRSMPATGAPGWSVGRAPCRERLRRPLAQRRRVLPLQEVLRPAPIVPTRACSPVVAITNWLVQNSCSLPSFWPPPTLVGVPTELVDRDGHCILGAGGLALDDHERDAVDEQHRSGTMYGLACPPGRPLGTGSPPGSCCAPGAPNRCSRSSGCGRRPTPPCRDCDASQEHLGGRPLASMSFSPAPPCSAPRQPGRCAHRRAKARRGHSG